MRIVIASALLMLALAGTVGAGEIYKDVDERGTPIYTDKPPRPGAKPLDIRSRPTDPAQVAAQRARLMGTDEADAPPPPEDAAPDPEAEAAARAEQCRLARERAQTYANAQRLYEPLPDGGRRYLTDEELDRARDEARQAVVRFCDE
ncbi:MAG: DUF4124 domain-containing protein [Gammaproteobacteria bacterium]